MAKAPKVRRGRGALAARRIVSRATGARLCFGRPVVAGERTVIPVASVQAAGGGGFGNGDDGDGGGGGGWISATPVGYIEISPEGARFHRILDPVSASRTVAALAGTALAAHGLRRALRRGAGGRLRRALPSPKR